MSDASSIAAIEALETMGRLCVDELEAVARIGFRIRSESALIEALLRGGSRSEAEERIETLFTTYAELAEHLTELGENLAHLAAGRPAEAPTPSPAPGARAAGPARQ